MSVPGGGTAMRLIKGLVWYLAFSALCVAATLAAMRQIAVRSGSEGLYESWLGEIGDAFDEAGMFIGDCYEKAEKKGILFHHGGHGKLQSCRRVGVTENITISLREPFEPRELFEQSSF